MSDKIKKLPGRKLWLLAMGLILVLAGSGFGSYASSSASPNIDPPGPDRYSIITVEYTEFLWWMVRWGETVSTCEFYVDHEGLPTPNDIYIECGETLYDKWVNQQPCTDINQCNGYYMVLINSHPEQKEISTKLQPAIVQATLENCNPIYTSFTSICEDEPILVLTGIEPLEGYSITGIEGKYDGQTFNCVSPCRLRLPANGEKIYKLQFWAYSSYGDSSELFSADIRVATTDQGNPDQDIYWYVDVLSSQWSGVPVASCVQSWQILPPIGGPPEWVSTPTDSEQLGTQIPYTYLAANLIKNKVVDASVCSDGGLLLDGSASACGMETARDSVNSWQNQFDDIILDVAKVTGAPAHLLKNLFAVESQFWPGNTKNDVGLGQLTEQGADTSLKWNPPFFKEFCPLVIDSSECRKGYLHMNEEQQSYLRLALIDTVNVTCENCPLGVDIEEANFSIDVFAHTLLANCEQASQVIKNYNEKKTPKDLGITYEDMWKFTMVNYNAGGGCLANAIEAAREQKEPMTFERVSLYLEPACQGAIEYVIQLSNE